MCWTCNTWLQSRNQYRTVLHAFLIQVSLKQVAKCKCCCQLVTHYHWTISQQNYFKSLTAASFQSLQQSWSHHLVQGLFPHQITISAPKKVSKQSMYIKVSYWSVYLAASDCWNPGCMDLSFNPQTLLFLLVTCMFICSLHWKVLCPPLKRNINTYTVKTLNGHVPCMYIHAHTSHAGFRVCWINTQCLACCTPYVGA